MDTLSTLVRPNTLSQRPLAGSAGRSSAPRGTDTFQQSLSGPVSDSSNLSSLLSRLIALLRGDDRGTAATNTATPSTTSTPRNTDAPLNTGTPRNTGTPSNTGTTTNTTGGSTTPSVVANNGSSYQQNFRSNVLNVASNNQSPFVFDEGKTDVAASDPFWVKTSESSLGTRSGVRPSDALNYAFNNPGTLTLDCTRGANMVFFKAELDTLGENAFNQRYANGLNVGGEALGNKPGFDVEARFANGTPQAGFNTIDNELTVFDPARGDRLVAGDSYYFENPGDNSTYLQGWTAIYMGQNNNGAHQFWTHPGGTVSTRLTDDGRFVASNGPFAGDYLSSLQASPTTGFA